MIGALSSTNVLMMDGSMQHDGIMYGLTQAVCHLTAHAYSYYGALAGVLLRRAALRRLSLSPTSLHPRTERRRRSCRR